MLTSLTTVSTISADLSTETQYTVWFTNQPSNHWLSKFHTVAEMANHLWGARDDFLINNDFFLKGI